MVVFDKLYTYDRPRNRTMLLLDIIVKMLVISGVALVALWIASEVLFRGRLFDLKLEFLQIRNSFGFNPSESASIYDPVPVSFAYVGVGVGFLGGILMYAGPILMNLVLAPPGGKLRNRVINDDEFAETTYECGETPIGSGQVQVNLQYYSFALVFIMFDIITALTLMFALVFSLGSGTTGTLNFGSLAFTPTSNDVFLQVLAVLFFILTPLLVLGFWLKKKAILWQ